MGSRSPFLFRCSCGRRSGRLFHGLRRPKGVKVDLEQRLVLLALLLILLSYADHLFFTSKPSPLGLCKDLFLVFGQAFDVLFNVLDALDEGAQSITGHPSWSAHAYLLVNATGRNWRIGGPVSSRVDKRGKEPINLARGRTRLGGELLTGVG